MDFKFKGKTWVGNIYQKFEAMCHEVDDFMTQDTVKYVENQVQTVGESVKNFCSDVVQDLLSPSLVDPFKHEAQAVSQKQNDANGTYTRSRICIEENPVEIDIKLSSVEENPIDPHCDASSFTGACLVKQFNPSPNEDPIKEAESDLSLGQVGDVLICKNAAMCGEGNATSDKGVDENVIKEERSQSEDLSFSEDDGLSEASLFSESIDENHRLLDLGVDENVVTEEQSQSEGLSSHEDESLSEASLLSESIDETHPIGVLAKVSPETLVNGVGIRSSKKEGTLCNSLLDEVDCLCNVSSTLQSSELALSIVSCENNRAETALISSSSYLSTESYYLSEFSRANFPQKAEKICYDPTDAIGYIPDLSDALSSSESSPTIACNNKDADMELPFSSSLLSLESNDADTSRIDEVVSVAGSSGNKHELCWHIDDSKIDIADPSMETIDLSDKMKLDESCVIVDGKSLYAVPCRTRKLRSYKKIIQDAFASRKRLTKEYEQLAILYGDIDIESGEHPKPNMLPSIATMYLESRKSPTEDLCDSEWEIL